MPDAPHVVVDACALFSRSFRLALVRLQETSLCRFYYTHHILEELEKNLRIEFERSSKSDPAVQAERAVNGLQVRADDSALLQSDFSLVESRVEVNEKDKHLIAVALVEQIDLVVTLDKELLNASLVSG